MPTVGARRHAEKMLEWGVDAVIAQGGEGGGHTGPVPTSLLLPAGGRRRRRRRSPCSAPAASTTGRGLVAALAYGADGIAMGTRFLLTPRAGCPTSSSSATSRPRVFDTVVTTALDGAPQRVIRTELIDKLERSSDRHPPAPRRRATPSSSASSTGTRVKDLVSEGLAMRKSQDLTLAQLAMAANAPMLIKAALVDGDPDVGVLPTGQVTGVIDELPTVAELIERIVAEARATLARLARLGAGG